MTVFTNSNSSCGVLRGPHRGFSFCYFRGKVGKISAHFSQIKSGHNPGKTGQSVKIGCFRLGIFKNF